MQTKHDHPSEILADDGNFRVESCPCGTIRVTLGALTLRLNREHSERFATVMARAMVRLSDLGRRGDEAPRVAAPAGASMH